MSIRVASTSLISGAVVVGNAGHGVLAQQIATTGDYGAGYAFSSLAFPADNGKEIRGLITTQPTTGTLYAYEDTSFTYVGANGAHTFQYQIYVDGVALGTPQTATINVGATSTVTSVAVTPGTATGSTTFTAVVNGTGSPSQAVTWATTAGSISAGGVFTAPAQTASVQTIAVTATSVQNSSIAPGTATVTISAGTSVVTGVTVSPSAATGSTTFTAVVAGTFSPSQSVTWSCTSGSINSSGLFIAPAQTVGTQIITVTATSTQNVTRSGTATITIPGTAGQTYVATPRKFNSPGRVRSFTSPARNA